MAVTQIDGGRQILAASITNAQIAAAAAIALSKLAEAVIQADGGQAYTADQSMGGFKLTNLAAPVSANDAARKVDIDNAAAGLDVKLSVRAATTVNGALATAYENGDSIDGVALVTGDRILLKDQTTGAENGIYTVNASGAPTRATDADTSAEVTPGMFVFVEEGTVNADTGWALTNNGVVTLGTTALVFAQFTGAGAIIGGAGLVKTGSTLDVVGTANRIVVSADAVDIGTDVVTLTAAQTLTNKSIAATQLTGQLPAANVPVFTGDVTSAGGALALTAGSAIQRTANIITRETPSGAINGSNVTFTLANTPVAGSEEVFLNGMLQEPGAGNDYTISGLTITYLTAPATGDRLRVNYRK